MASRPTLRIVLFQGLKICSYCPEIMLHSTPLVSIITVCLNERKRIEQTAKSIVNQTCQDFEWIVIDGGSADGTLEVLEKYRDRMQVFISEKDKGVYHAMNKGIRLARGEYCLFMNGGDMLYDEHALKNFFDFEEKADINYGGIVEVHGNENREKFIHPIHNMRDYLYRYSLPHQGTFIRNELFNKCGEYDTQYNISADREFFIRAILGFKASVCHLPWICSIYYFDGLSCQAKNTSEMRIEKKIIKKKYFSYTYRLRLALNIIFSRLVGRSA